MTFALLFILIINHSVKPQTSPYEPRKLPCPGLHLQAPPYRYILNTLPTALDVDVAENVQLRSNSSLS